MLSSLYDEELYSASVSGISLLTAVSTGNAPLVAHLLRHKTELDIDIDEVDEKGQSSLIVACSRGNSKIASYLLQMEANPDIKDNDGYAAIHHCVLASANKAIGVSKAASCIRILARFRCNVDRKTADGRSALHLAVQNSLTDITIALRDAGNKLQKHKYYTFGIILSVGKQT